MRKAQQQQLTPTVAGAGSRFAALNKISIISGRLTRGIATVFYLISLFACLTAAVALFRSDRGRNIG